MPREGLAVTVLALVIAVAGAVIATGIIKGTVWAVSRLRERRTAKAQLQVDAIARRVVEELKKKQPDEGADQSALTAQAIV
jgi:hypothetical protein